MGGINLELVKDLAKDALKDPHYDEDGRKELKNIVEHCDLRLKYLYGYAEAFNMLTTNKS